MRNSYFCEIIEQVNRCYVKMLVGIVSACNINTEEDMNKKVI